MSPSGLPRKSFQTPPLQRTVYDRLASDRPADSLAVAHQHHHHRKTYSGWVLSFWFVVSALCPRPAQQEDHGISRHGDVGKLWMDSEAFQRFERKPLNEYLERVVLSCKRMRTAVELVLVSWDRIIRTRLWSSNRHLQGKTAGQS